MFRTAAVTAMLADLGASVEEARADLCAKHSWRGAFKANQKLGGVVRKRSVRCNAVTLGARCFEGYKIHRVINAVPNPGGRQAVRAETFEVKPIGAHPVVAARAAKSFSRCLYVRLGKMLAIGASP